MMPSCNHAHLALFVATIATAGCDAKSEDVSPASVNTSTSAPTAYGNSSAESRRFVTLADEYLDGWATLYPSIAAGNGLHAHDGALEDFSAEAMATQVAWFKSMRARLDSIATDRLTPDEQVDHRILTGIIDGWLLDIDTVKNWRRNPMLYASAIADGVHNLMTMESSSTQDRMRRVTSKLEGVQRLLDAGRANLVNPPRVLVERGIAMMRGASAQLGGDLEKAFPGPRGETWNAMHVQARKARASIDAFVTHLEKNVLPTANGEIALGKQYVESRYRAEELIDVPVETLLAIGMRELSREQALFAAKAKEIDPERDAIAVWRDILKDHPKRGELVVATQRTVDELRDFVVARNLVVLPNDERVVVEPSKPYDIGLASMHASPPLETTPVRSIYYVTDADTSWPPERQEKWLERFNLPSLAITSAHEAMPGHFVHALFMRQTPGKIRRIWIGLNPFPQPSSGQDGWAHYAEQLVVEQGFHEDDPRYAMAQLSESMTRICRLVAGIKVHAHGWSIAQAASFFETEAHVPGPAAMQEATRLAYDPTNGGYFLGKRALLTLRDDYRARVGDTFTLADFHARVMRNGIAPWWAHRRLMLPGDSGAVVR
jgi:uncharacterized protein (DUF885 family)